MEAEQILQDGPLMRVKEVAELVHACGNTVRRLMKAGELPYVRLGRTRGIRIAQADVLRLLERRRAASRP